jgi:4-alpha-glucanotransferase
VLRFVDVVRLDHFRGFAGYYEIPYGAPTAETGQWMSGPGKDFFKTVSRELSDTKNSTLPIIAEDLGVITPDVVELREFYASPLGNATRRLISAKLKPQLGPLSDACVLGLGFATPS